MKTFVEVDDKDGDFEYTCEQCGYKSATTKQYNKHIRNSPDHLPICKECDSKFSSMKYLQDHVRRYHFRGGKVSCIECGKISNSQQQHYAHWLFLHKVDEDLYCNLCYSPWKNILQLKRHMKKCLIKIPAVVEAERIENLHKSEIKFVYNWTISEYMTYAKELSLKEAEEKANKSNSADKTPSPAKKPGRKKRKLSNKQEKLDDEEDSYSVRKFEVVKEEPDVKNDKIPVFNNSNSLIDHLNEQSINTSHSNPHLREKWKGILANGNISEAENYDYFNGHIENSTKVIFHGSDIHTNSDQSNDFEKESDDEENSGKTVKEETNKEAIKFEEEMLEQKLEPADIKWEIPDEDDNEVPDSNYDEIGENIEDRLSDKIEDRIGDKIEDILGDKIEDRLAAKSEDRLAENSDDMAEQNIEDKKTERFGDSTDSVNIDGEAKCKVCGVFTKNLRAHMFRLHKPTPVPCHICGMIFKSETFLKRHIKKEHGNEEVVCKLCGKLTRNLKTHNKFVHEAQPCTCDICGKVFGNSLKLGNHKRKIHIYKEQKQKEVKMKVCNICGKEASNMSSHYKYVHEENPVPCNICGTVLMNTMKLKKHITKVHPPIDIVTCNVCGQNFENKYKLYHHNYAVHSNQESKCDICGRTYKNLKALGAHKNWAHKQEKGGENSSHLQESIT